MVTLLGAGAAYSVSFNEISSVKRGILSPKQMQRLQAMEQSLRSETEDENLYALKEAIREFLNQFDDELRMEIILDYFQGVTLDE